MSIFSQPFKLVWLALAGLACLIGPSAVLGADNSGTTFSIIPARQELASAAGQSQIFSLKVINQSDQTEHFRLAVLDLYPAQGGTGFSFTRENTASAEPYLFSRLNISLPTELELLPGQTKLIPVEISVPNDWPPLSLQGVINLTLDQAGSGATARLNTSAGAIVLLRLAGQTKESGRLLRFNALSAWLTSSDNPRLQIAYQNEGNVYLNPYGVITIKDWRGRALQKNYVDPWFILPGAIRNREMLIAPLTGHWWPGFYRAELDLNLGFNNQLSSASTYFIISPDPWTLALILAIILGVGYLGFKLKKHV